MNSFQDVENARKIYRNKKNIIFKIVFIITIVEIALSIISMVVSTISINQLTTTKTEIGFFMIPIFIAPLMIIVKSFIIYIAICAIVTRKEKNNYDSQYRSYFISRCLSIVFTDIQYDHNSKMPEQIIRDTHSVMMGNRYYSNDFMTAKYHGLPFSQADVLIQSETTDSDGNTSTRTLFKGQWLIFDFNKKLSGNLQVIKKGFSDATYNRKNVIETESIEFNKQFIVVAKEGFDAFYVLDPALMESIEWLGKNIEGSFMLCFCDNKLHIALNNNKDAFEPRYVKQPLNEQEEIARVGKEIKTITDFVEKLKLDKKLFKD